MRNFILLILAVVVALHIVDFVGNAIDRSIQYEQQRLDNAIPLRDRARNMAAAG